MERKWVICAVGDIRGFGMWTSRSSVTIEIQEPFLNEYYDVMESHVRTTLDSNFKYLGDGFQVVKEFDSYARKNGAVSDFMSSLRKVIGQSMMAVDKCPEPPPDGFRIRWFSGFVFKRMVLDPNDDARKRLIPEYVGYVINTAHRLLEVNPEIPNLCDGKLAVGRRSFFRMRSLKTPSCYPRGVDREDVDGLKIIQI